MSVVAEAAVSREDVDVTLPWRNCQKQYLSMSETGPLWRLGAEDKGLVWIILEKRGTPQMGARGEVHKGFLFTLKHLSSLMKRDTDSCWLLHASFFTHDFVCSSFLSFSNQFHPSQFISSSVWSCPFSLMFDHLISLLFFSRCLRTALLFPVPSAFHPAPEHWCRPLPSGHKSRDLFPGPRATGENDPRSRNGQIVPGPGARAPELSPPAPGALSCHQVEGPEPSSKTWTPEFSHNRPLCSSRVGGGRQDND